MVTVQFIGSKEILEQIAKGIEKPIWQFEKKILAIRFTTFKKAKIFINDYSEYVLQIVESK